MRIVRALPGTLGLVAFVLTPAAAATLNLAAGLAQIHVDESSAKKTDPADVVVVATWDEASEGFVLSRRTRTPALAEGAKP